MVLSTFGYLLKNVHLRRCPHFSSLQHTTGRERFKTVPYIEFRLPAGSPPRSRLPKNLFGEQVGEGRGIFE